jgi:chemotaxis protein CheD
MNLNQGQARATNLRVVGISELLISGEPDDVLVTYSLGSCLGLALHDPVAGVGGMIHCMLPLSSSDPERARVNPERFVDSGVSRLLQGLFDRGAKRRNLVAKVAGMAAMMDLQQIFNIGERNYTVLRKILWKNDILISGKEVGGTATRTLFLEISTGRTRIRSGGREWDL